MRERSRKHKLSFPKHPAVAKHSSLRYHNSVSKKRPRISNGVSKRDPAYWRERIYKNAFTYKGKHVEVRSWSVKIQLLGKRKAFTLTSATPAQAADEACELYHTILKQGWDALTHRQSAGSRRDVSESLGSSDSVPTELEYWKPRLIQRKYPELAQPESNREFSVRIEHARTAHYFPLGTSDENEAAAQAVRIYQTIINEGWDRANATFPRELSLALRWQDNPLAWTYTTFHTGQNTDSLEPAANSAESSSMYDVVFIEPDAQIRSALAAYTNRQPGFRCDTTFTTAAEALREIPRRNVDLALANHDLPVEASVACFEELHRLRPNLVVLSYSLFPDPDELFKSTPGGSVVYLLKRTPPGRLFDPIAAMTGTPTHEVIASQVRNYFQQLSALLPAGPPFWKTARLTPREHEILALLSKGDLVKEIAGKLGISNWTVQGHVKSIFEKLNVHSRTEAVVKYLQR